MPEEEKELNMPETIVPKEIAQSSKKKSTLMPYLLTILGIVILGALAYGYWQYKSDSGLTAFGHKYGGKTVAATTTVMTSATTGTMATTGAVATDWKTYTNATYGFSLNFSDEWIGYKTKTITSTADQVAMIQYYLPTSNQSAVADSELGGKYFYAFAVVIYTPQQWAALQSSNEAMVTLIKSGTSYVYTYVGSQLSPPSDIAAKTINIPNVISTFKITDPTVGWKTYTNTTYGYSIKYPSTWFLYVDKNSTGEDRVYIESVQRGNGGVNDSDYLDLDVAKYPSETKNTFIESDMNQAKETVTISGVSGTVSHLYNGNSTTDILDNDIFLPKNGYIYSLNTAWDNGADHGDAALLAANKQILADIVNTFQFTN